MPLAGPTTGVDVMISLDPFRGSAIAGKHAVTAVGYTEGHVGTTMSPLDDMSRLIPTGHSDFRRDYSIPARPAFWKQKPFVSRLVVSQFR